MVNIIIQLSKYVIIILMAAIRFPVSRFLREIMKMKKKECLSGRMY